MTFQYAIWSLCPLTERAQPCLAANPLCQVLLISFQPQLANSLRLSPWQGEHMVWQWAWGWLIGGLLQEFQQ